MLVSLLNCAFFPLSILFFSPVLGVGLSFLLGLFNPGLVFRTPAMFPLHPPRGGGMEERVKEENVTLTEKLGEDGQSLQEIVWVQRLTDLLCLTSRTLRKGIPHTGKLL